MLEVFPASPALSLRLSEIVQEQVLRTLQRNSCKSQNKDYKSISIMLI